MQFAIQVVFPEFEKFMEGGEAAGDVEFLPDIGLQEARVIGEVVENFSGGLSVTAELKFQAGRISSAVLWMPTGRVCGSNGYESKKTYDCRALEAKRQDC